MRVIENRTKNQQLFETFSPVYSYEEDALVYKLGIPILKTSVLYFLVLEFKHFFIIWLVLFLCCYF